MKNKEKLGLIDDYIKIMQVLNFSLFLEKKNAFSDSILLKKIILLSLKLKSGYEQVFSILKMYDLSMKILLKDLSDIDFEKFVSTIDIQKKLEDYGVLLEEIESRFVKNLNKITNNIDNSAII